MKKYYIFSILIIFSTYTYASECKNLTTQIEMTDCSIKKLEETEENLNKKIKKLSEILADDGGFALANKAWLEYRNKHCASTTKIYEGGSIYNYVLTECKINQTNLRIKILENDYKQVINIITKGAP